jgi:hypothetical protein
MLHTPCMKTRKRKNSWSRPCSVCGKWFTPNVRVRGRQKTCGDPACRAEHRRRRQQSYREKNRVYWIQRRLDQQAAKAEAGEARGPPGRLPAGLTSGIPWEHVQDLIGAERFVFIVLLSRVLHGVTQDLISTQVLEAKEEILAIRRQPAQDVMAHPGHRCHDPP